MLKLSARSLSTWHLLDNITHSRGHSFYVNQPFWVRTLSAWRLNTKVRHEWSQLSPGALRVNDLSVFASDNRRGKQIGVIGKHAIEAGG